MLKIPNDAKILQVSISKRDIDQIEIALCSKTEFDKVCFWLILVMITRHMS